ncbi:MAG TPA: ABC transporter permease subunit, partial [Negativicutes bacterium]|nr:ABC transporter permease subunit [Negativicutes bacterium]
NYTIERPALPAIRQSMWTVLERTYRFSRGFLIVLPAAGILLPIMAMFVCSFSERWSSNGISGFTFAWYNEVFDYPGFLDSILLSLKVAFLTALFDNIIGLPLAYALAKYSFPGKSAVTELFRLPIIKPGLVFALALIICFGDLYGSWHLLLIAHVVFSLPFFVEPVLNCLRAFDFVMLENAARTLGATQLKCHYNVLLPLLRVPIIVGSTTVFTISWSEFNVSFLLSSAKAYPISGLLYAAYTGTSIQFSSAASMVFISVLIPFLLALNYAGQKLAEPK